MDTKGTVTVTSVEAVIIPLVAVIVVVPVLRAFMIPALPAALLIVATKGDDDVQITDCNGGAFEPYNDPELEYPVAVKESVVPTGTCGLEGEVVIDANCGSAKVEGW